MNYLNRIAVTQKRALLVRRLQLDNGCKFSNLAMSPKGVWVWQVLPVTLVNAYC